MEEAFSEWILHSAHFTISLFPLWEAWQQVVVTSDCQRPRSQVENLVPNIPVMNAGESDSLGQLVGSTPQQPGGANAVKGAADARLALQTGDVQPHSRPPKSQCTVVDGGACFPPPLTEECWTLMGTPPPVRSWAGSINAGATEGVRRGSGWHL